MHEAKEVTTPLSPSDKLKLNDKSSPYDSTKYRQVLGTLQDLSLTRPNVSFAINKLAQFMHQPTSNH